MKFVVIDFETASACDLKKAGAWRYAEDPTTEVLCLGHAPDGLARIVLYGNSLQFNPLNVVDQRAGSLELAATDPNVIFIAHAVQFEKAIWRKIMVPYYGWPDIPNSRWHDSQAVCAQKALPLKLEKAALVLRLAEQKDTDGQRHTTGMSRAKKGYYDRSPEAIKRVVDYNMQDLATEIELNLRVGGLQTCERPVWLLDQRINERGFAVDLEYVEASQAVVDGASKPLLAEFRTLTDGLNPTQRDKVMTWVAGRGVKLDNLRKETITKLLGATDEELDEELDEEDELADTPLFGLPDDVKRALYIRRSLGSASIKKLGRVTQCVCMDGRVRGGIQYHGAGPGRWAGRLFQPHNFPRGSLKMDNEPVKTNYVVDAIMTRDWQHVSTMFGDPIEVVSSGLRHIIVPSAGRLLNVGDFAKIECVIVLALAGAHKAAADVIARGSAIYTDTATKIFGRPITKHMLKEYTIGKNTILGCGFQMGDKTFRSRYWPDGSEEDCKGAISQYRDDFAPEVPKLWYGLEAAGVRAVWDHKTTEAYGVQFKHEDIWLTARLPSGRKLYYAYPRKIEKAMTWDETDIRAAWTCQAQKGGRWITRDMYGGLLTENVVQALARDLMVAAMFKCEKEALPVVLTVHDEIVSEPLTEHSDHNKLAQIMADRPRWAIEMQVPVAAETWEGDRYRK